ncbi:tripartite tricarboxylate transporter permease [Thermococcus sp.]|uniref:tripartite tricarboxylate transporter permease n=1 Tax=Thermococcus sp. TaxID=35749 RepID=UPI0019C96DB3|nr:tripartite tricarboxylate transporter permease [Thermococcus sp.]MBC7095849.1 tripartite tricarboxylate transporter permease [Thermococcus sp.]
MLRELILGMLGGTLTGLTPSLHVNTLASIVNNIELPISDFSFVLLVYAMGLTHTFLDAFPSTFFGVPDESMALSALPAHRLALQGKGLEVINLSLKASLLAAIFSIALIPLYLIIAPHYTPQIGRAIVFLLAFLIIVTEKGIKKLYALFVFLMAGILGIVSDRVPLNEPFYHLFVGLFGVPAILLSLDNNNKISGGDGKIEMSQSQLIAFSFLGTIFGMMASLLPTFTSSQAALIGSFITKSERTFLTITFAVNTANFIFGLGNFYSTGKTRNGILVLIRERYYPINFHEFLALLMATLTVASIVNLYGLWLSKKLVGLIEKLDYRLLNALILLATVLGSFFLDGPFGVLVLLAATLVGLTAVFLGVKRTACMGVLMLRVMLG